MPPKKKRTTRKGKVRIEMFIHCKTCNLGYLEVGTSAQGEIVIWCPDCDKLVGVLGQMPGGPVKCAAC